ncbi:MAG: 50S ribosomal protein L1 [Armatimonadota bacterium]
MTKSKNYRESLTKIDRTKLYDPSEAIELLKQSAKAKFDETVEVSYRLGIDPKKTDQNVRGTIVLPHGTGKEVRIIAFAKGDKAKEAQDAGANEAGADDLINKIKGGWMDFDIAVASPDMMADIGKNLGRILGPKMPNPKAGTVTPDIARAVKELKAGKIQYRNDKQGIINNIVGKASFENQKLLENLLTLTDAILRAKPASAKGIFLRSVVVSSTMSPGIKLDPQVLTAQAQGKK